MPDTFKALLLTNHDAQNAAQVVELRDSDLPDGDILLKIAYSSLNYKDGLAVSGTAGIVRQWPMVPGIDLAGRVLESEHAAFPVGTEVIATGWGLGERHWGGYSQRQRVRSAWLVAMPPNLDALTAMAAGTAGLTAMLCIMTLEEAGLTPDAGSLVVSGASGGVGSFAVALLAGLGYQVCAVTGKADAADYLRALGATEIIERKAMASAARALEPQRWAGAVDTVGGLTLARIIAETRYGGCIAACGLAGGSELPTTVMPFILRNVSLRGVDSVQCPAPRREVAWRRLAAQMPREALDQMTRIIGLDEVLQSAADILAGKIQGRVIVDPNR